MIKKFLFSFLLFSALAWSGGITLQDQNATDPIYRLPMKEYPKWLCEAKLKDGKTAQFVSVKAMMQVFQNQDYFLKRKLLSAPIEAIYVQDYISGEKIDARKAVYLFGSKIVGPHGDDLIPFSSEENAKLFEMKNGGTKILPYERLTKGLIRYLDM